ncbi:hypothetical protein EVG20_g6644 [Dentipellis fragilis]|uniref:Chromo domain-containing protein n=1 Tax=Dentipellis fragilis TaxID=205917 RepID=A0A4Y9YJ93_9AGAM|nr:hypothetical protein EVG20_g6644 [Dentipellis fragilis]
MDNWVELLPFAEFGHNAKAHSATSKSPFEILHGYAPRLLPPLHFNQKVPTVEEHLCRLDDIRKEVHASLQLASEQMKKNADQYRQKNHLFRKGHKVWFDGKNLHLQYPKAKLTPKRYGPFEITDIVGPVNCHLKLPKTWKIHPVFHVSLLMPYHETPEYGPNYARPSPDIIQGEQEFEVEDIIKSRHFGKNKRLQYLIKWRGYPHSDNSWEPAGHLTHAQKLITAFYKRHPSAPRLIRTMLWYLSRRTPNL